jgi:DNA-binding NarL/FixJ family response regulator
MRRPRILLCDDHPAILTLLHYLLEPHYHVVGTAEDGQSLVAAAQALRPDIVFTDINMPHVNGLEATRELRKHLPGCHVIVHSSHDEPEVMAAAFAAGASGYVVKGSTNALESSIRTVIETVWAQATPPVMAQDCPSQVRGEGFTRLAKPIF